MYVLLGANLKINAACHGRLLSLFIHFTVPTCLISTACPMLQRINKACAVTSDMLFSLLWHISLQDL